ncbi:MAG TPA: hypothetical protein VH796_01915 [Nitrososphaeraceae archaeon]|jgi:hypothetical protein
MPNEVKKQSERAEKEERSSIKVEKQGKFEIHRIDAIQDQQQSLHSKVSILIIDSKVSLIDEANTYNKEGNKNLALATYSNSESTLLDYISIFETF